MPVDVIFRFPSDTNEVIDQKSEKLMTRSENQEAVVLDKTKADKNAKLEAYSSALFQNWSSPVNNHDRYYVQAPIDRLGSFAFHLRTHIVSLILAGNPAIDFLQSKNSPALTVLARFFRELGLEPFLFILVSSFVWLFDATLGRYCTLSQNASRTLSSNSSYLLYFP